jgi:oligoendopeptidase F
VGPLATPRRDRPNRFLPDIFNAADPAAVEALYARLEERPLESRAALEALLLDWDEFEAFLWERHSRAYVEMTQDTADAGRQERYASMVEGVLPIIERHGARLKQRVLNSPAVDDLGSEYAVFLRHIRAEMELYAEENLPLLTRELTLSQEYEAISGAQQAVFQDRPHTLPQLWKFLQEPDREVREAAWRARSRTQLADADTLDALFDRLLEVRREIARNAGCADYREYAFRKLKRFDYGPEECLQLHAAIERQVVPVAAAAREWRRESLGIGTMRPWDLAADAGGNAPPRPFERVEELEEGCQRILARLDPQFGEWFARMRTEQLLDTANRPGKAPGGYMEVFAHQRTPFIFMNAVGTQRDVETLLHEAGHAFNYFLARDLPLHAYRFPPLEFAEVASMSMELLARPLLDEFYGDEERARLADEQIRNIMGLFCHLAMSDAFQHWLYTSDDTTAEARRARWSELEERYRPGVDWSGFEEVKGIGWQFLHIFTHPFYIIEYAIAQLASLGIWLRWQREPERTLADFKGALSLGGSRPLPELFGAAGLEFDFSEGVVAEVVAGALAQMRES